MMGLENEDKDEGTGVANADLLTEMALSRKGRKQRVVERIGVINWWTKVLPQFSKLLSLLN